ncbi:MAG: hypothetical protein HY791_24585 [Deltaproteobacteria bacterium]|nr:hypothetical protein [Deltaproteobacteria bacterium]
MSEPSPSDPNPEAPEEAKKKRGKVKISKKLLFINSTSSVVARVLNISVLIWVQQYLLRRITPEEYSLLPVVTSLMILVPLISFALTTGFGRFVTAAYDEGKLEEVTQIVSSVFPILAIVAVLMLFGGAFTAYHVDSLINVPAERIWDARLMFGMLLISAVVNLVLSPFIVAFTALQKFVLKNLIEVGSELFRMALLTALLLLEGPRVIWVVASESAANVVLVLVLQYFSRKWLPALRVERAAIDLSKQRELMSFSAWGFVIKTSGFIRTTLNPIILNRLATPLDVACFHLGTIVTRQLQTIGNNAAAASGPMLTALHVRGEREALKQAYLSGNRYSMWLSMAIACPLVASAPEIFRLYAGDEYALAAPVLMLSLASFPFRYGTSMLARLASAVASQKGYGLALAALQFVDLILALVFVGAFKLGAVGVAIATLISTWLVLPFVHFPIGLRLSGARLGEYATQSLLRGLVPSVVALPVLFGVRHWVQPTTWLEVFVISFAGLLAYGAAILTLALGPEERDDVARIRTKILAKVLARFGSQ